MLSSAVTSSGKPDGPPGARGTRGARGRSAEPAGERAREEGGIETLTEVDGFRADDGWGADTVASSLSPPTARSRFAAGAAAATAAAGRFRLVPRPLDLSSPAAEVGGRPVDEDAPCPALAPPPPTGENSRSTIPSPTPSPTPILPPLPLAPRPPSLSPLPPAGLLWGTMLPLPT